MIYQNTPFFLLDNISLKKTLTSVDKTFPKNFLTLIMAAYFFLKNEFSPLMLMN